jgi:hypothetical protein
MAGYGLVLGHSYQMFLDRACSHSHTTYPCNKDCRPSVLVDARCSALIPSLRLFAQSPLPLRSGGDPRQIENVLLVTQLCADEARHPAARVPPRSTQVPGRKQPLPASRTPMPWTNKKALHHASATRQNRPRRRARERARIDYQPPKTFKKMPGILAKERS